MFDKSSGTLQREGVAAELNPYDRVALEVGLQCIERYGGSVTAVCMGPDSAEAALREALAMGANAACLLRSAAFAGADVLATAYTLSAYFSTGPDFDLILCGKHSVDGDTGQTGAALAEHLGIPHAAAVSEILRIADGRITVRQRLDGALQTVRLEMPCLLVTEQDICYPRLPTLAGTLRAKGQLIPIETEESIAHIDLRRCGLKGSATRVKHISTPETPRHGRMLAPAEYDCLLPLLLGQEDGV